MPSFAGTRRDDRSCGTRLPASSSGAPRREVPSTGSQGRDNRVIMLRAGSDSELSSGLPHDQATLLATLPRIGCDAAGRSLASAELVVMPAAPTPPALDPRALPAVLAYNPGAPISPRARHTCFEVADYDAMKATLEREGIKYVENTQSGGRIQMLCNDPDGNTLEFQPATA